MTNFSLVPDHSPERILGVLRQKAPDFFSSDEYLRLEKLGAGAKNEPGLLCAAFAKFLCAKIEAGVEVRGYFTIIEDWASAQDCHIENYLITEIFENVRLPTRGEDTFKDRLGPAARKLYERWMEDPPEDRLSR